MLKEVMPNVPQFIMVLAYTMLVGLAQRVTETHCIMMF